MIPKYRAWDTTNKEMFKDTFAITESGQVVVVDQSSVFVSPDYVFVDNLVIMQSTGLFDRNGKEIFEGDIVSVGTATRVVKKNNLLGFYIEEGEKIGYFSDVVDVNCLDLFVKDFGEEAEIIGNIYENPELLEDKE